MDDSHLGYTHEQNAFPIPHSYTSLEALSSAAESRAARQLTPLQRVKLKSLASHGHPTV